jgi:hypothetical protein
MAERGLVAQTIHRQGRWLSTQFGRSTAGLRMWPDFLIVGAQRAGTTSLYKTLVQHPEVLPAGLHKGVHYFDTDYERGARWYRSHFPTRTWARLTARRVGHWPITGEASPYYMFHPLVPARIAHDVPEARLVVMLRDPVERAYSAYTHERARGFETLSFEDALAAEDERLAGEEDRMRRDPSYVSLAHQHNAYLARGRYVDQLERLEAEVGRDRLCVVDSDDMFLDFRNAFTEILDFLGLSEWMPEQFEQKNARPRTKIDPVLRARLEDHFAPYDERLEAWWGRRPGWRG